MQNICKTSKTMAKLEKKKHSFAIFASILQEKTCFSPNFCKFAIFGYNLQEITNTRKFAKKNAKYLQNKQKPRQNSKKKHIFLISANILQKKMYIFAKKNANLQFSGTTSGKAGKIAKKLVNLRKKNAKYLQNICKRFSKYLQKTRRQNSKKKNIFCKFCKYFAKKTQFSKCKMNPAYKKYANGTCKSIAKKCKNHSFSTSQSLPKKFS